MFASGLNAVAKGGALLRCLVPASAIIAGPSKHSLYIDEGEYTVDPRGGLPVEQLQRFAPSA